jgi:hypothetical protein
VDPDDKGTVSRQKIRMKKIREGRFRGKQHSSNIS